MLKRPCASVRARLPQSGQHFGQGAAPPSRGAALKTMTSALPTGTPSVVVIAPSSLDCSSAAQAMAAQKSPAPNRIRKRGKIIGPPSVLRGLANEAIDGGAQSLAADIAGVHAAVSSEQQ